MYFFLRGTPFIYQGQEIGMMNFERESIQDFDDISSIDNYQRAILEGYTETEALHFVNLRSRDNARTPMQWNSISNGGFNLGRNPWLKFSDDEFKKNVSAQKNDDNSILNFYNKLISMRNIKYPEALISGTFEVVESDENIIAYKRSCNAYEIYSITNLSNTSTYMKLPKGEVLINNYLTIEENLHPYQTLLIWSKL